MNAQSNPLYDESAWPVLHVTMPAELSGDALARHLERIGAWLARGVPQVHVIDMRACQGFKVEDRARIAEFDHAYAAFSSSCLRGKAYIADAWRQRDVIGGLAWQLEAPYLVRCFCDPHWALVWARARAVG
jgi:hypothetical protein